MAADNPDEIWGRLQAKVQDAVRANFPLEGRDHRLVLHGVAFDEKKDAPHHDIRSQEKAKFEKKTWGVPLVGDIGLVDKYTGKELDRAKVKLLTLPKTTNRYSYIVDGGEWQVDNLWRLKSGVYAHVQQNGNLQAEFNLAKPFVRESRIYIPFDPQSKSFKFKYATTHLPLYSILRMMGVQDAEMQKAWGPEIYKVNATPKVEKNVANFFERLKKRGLRAEGTDYDSMASAIVKEFGNARLLPETTKHVFGKPIDHVSGEALLLASKRILEVARGDRPPDDRDSLVFKKLHTVDDFLHERLTHPKALQTVRFKVSNNIDRQSKVRDVISGDLFSKPIKEFFTSATVSRNPEQVNPLEMITNHRVTTVLGGDAGGIGNDRAITNQMRLINPSHLGFLDPIHGPESERTGITLHLPMGVKQIDGEAKARVYDTKERKEVWVTPGELHAEHVVMPDQVTWKDGAPKPIAAHVKMKDPVSHDIVPKPFADARYVLLSPHQLFDEATNLMPFLQDNQGNRAMTASRQQTQAVSLATREQPLVQVQAGEHHTRERIIGQPFSHLAHVAGTVTEIKRAAHNNHPEAIVITNAAGEKHEVPLYNHFPLNDAKTHLHSTPLVKVGDAVKKDQVVADTNFTRNGVLSLGSNLHVAYLPYRGYNFEDGIVISETAAKKLSSDHLHRRELELDPEKDVLSKAKFTAFAPTVAKVFTKEQAAKLDDSGVVRVGQTVRPGDVLVAAIGKRELTGEAGRVLGRLSRKGFDYVDKSVAWDSDHPGEVVNVLRDPTGKGVTVHVRTAEPMEIGDKLVGRHGNKAIVTKILPDHEMPRVGGPEGKPVEVLMNPSGVASRINLGQLLETAAGRIAAKTGKPYVVNNFGGPNVDYTQKVKDDLAAHGLKDTDTLYDPQTHKPLGDVLNGPQYILKLKHQVEKKLAVRSHSQNYTIDHAPTGTGADHPGQGIGQLDFYALLAHGARANIRDMATYKADRQLDEQMNPMAHVDFWHRVQTGQPLPAPKPTFAYKKFEALLTGLGVNVRKEGNQLQLTPLTDRGVLALSKGEIADPGRVLRGKDAKELERGLFDPKVTGGLPNDVGKGLFWSHIRLAEPFPNPVFVGSSQQAGPIPILTGLKVAELEQIAQGKKYVDGKTGGHAISDMLKKINVSEELTKTKAGMGKLRGTELDRANRKVKYLQALAQLDLKPHDAYMMQNVPVLPPVFRPIVTLPNGSLRFDDVNYYYRNLGLVNNQLKQPVAELGDQAHQPLREQTYDLLKALAGIGGKPVYESSRPLKGLLETISGDTPKTGFFQSHLMKRRQELSMRSTITPDPAMHLDHVGLPKAAALELYKPFVIRELGRLGYNPLAATREVKQGSPTAIRALQRAMDQRPVILKRDPVLHKYSMMAFKPRVVEGRAIQIHPLVTAGFNADFDGDTMAAHVPLTDEAVVEAHKMLPSNNLFSATHGGIMYAPDQEALIGLHLLGRWGKKTDHEFATFQEAQRAHDRGAIQPSDVIRVSGKETTLGRLTIAQHLPDQFKNNGDLLHNPKLMLVKHGGDGNRLGIHNLLEEIAKKDPKNYPQTVDGLKNLGNAYSYQAGFSFRLSDLDVPKKLREDVLAKYRGEAEAVQKKTTWSQPEKDNKLIEIYNRATEELNKAGKGHYKHEENNIFAMVDSGARGKWGQFRQMNIAPMLLKDGQGRTLPQPVTKSYAEGLDVGDYWRTLHGARMGTLQKVMGTSEPGRLSKEIVNTVMPSMVVSKDCGTTHGISMRVDEDDVHDRFLAASVKLQDHVVPAGTLVTPQLTAQLKKSRIDKVVVRSPLKCAHGHGLCAKCYGLNQDGHLHEVGTNLGVIAGHALGEPATQIAMDCNAAGNLVTVRNHGHVVTLTFEQLWNRIDSLVDVDDDVETKIPDALEVWDHTEYVPVRVMQRHKPHSQMVLVRLDSGHAFVTQSTHPNWGRLFVPKCPHCGDQEPVIFVGHYKSGLKTSVRCSACRKAYTLTKEEYEAQQERVVRSEQLEGTYLGISEHTCEQEKTAFPLPPYLLGSFLAEGNVKRTKVTGVPEDGAKQRQKAPSGLRWKILGAVYTQDPGELREHLKTELVKANLEFCEPSEKHIQLGDVELARKLWQQCGIGSRNKQLPSGWRGQSKAWRLHFLAGLLDGDGTLTDGHTGALDTTSWALVSQVQELVRSLDGWSTVYATTVKELTRNQGYRVVLDLPVRLPSVKDFPIVCDASRRVYGSYARVTQVKEVAFYTDWTYDLATDTRGFTASGIRTHNSFHSGGISDARGGKSFDKFTRLNQLLEMPKVLPGAAALSLASGTVHSIERDPGTNGWNIHVASVKKDPDSGKTSRVLERHFATAHQHPTVTVGQEVAKGDALTTGPINPHQLLALTDIHRAQNYLTDELNNAIYKDERVKRRNIETVVRSLTNLTRVEDPGDSEHLHGDLALRSVVEEQNRGLKQGQRIVHRPLLRGARQVALDQHEDWMARLNFQRLRDTVLEGTAKGWRTDLHGINPVAPFAVGATFGKGTKAQPHLY